MIGAIFATAAICIGFWLLLEYLEGDEADNHEDPPYGPH